MDIQSVRRWFWPSLVALVMALALALSFSSGVTAQGPADEVPHKEPEMIQVAPEGDAAKRQNEDGTECYPCWVTGVRIQKLQYPNYQPLAGWQFDLIGANGQVLRTETTDANGFANFYNVPAGIYRVRERPQVNWQVVYPPSGEMGLPVYGGYVTFFRFYNRQGGIVPPTPPTPPADNGSLQLCKRDVTNPASVQNVQGFTLNYTRIGGGSTVQATTADNGCVTVTVPIGVYRVEEPAQQGWDFVSVTPDTDGPFNRSTQVQVNSGQTTTVTFANRRTPQQTSTAIRACKLEQLDGGQTRPVAGWAIGIRTEPSTGAFRYGYTGYDGCVTFGNLPAGQFAVEEARPAGWRVVSVNPPATGDNAYRTVVTTTAGQTTAVTFTNQRIIPATIRACKLAVGTGETPLSGWQMTLRRTDQNNTVIASAPTGWGSGCVTFGPLEPGSYVVEEAAYPGWTLVSITGADSTDGLRATINVDNSENAIVTFRNRRATTTP